MDTLEGMAGQAVLEFINLLPVRCLGSFFLLLSAYQLVALARYLDCGQTVPLVHEFLAILHRHLALCYKLAKSVVSLRGQLLCDAQVWYSTNSLSTILLIL